MHRFRRLWLALCFSPLSVAALQPDLNDLDLLPLHTASHVQVAKRITDAQEEKGQGPAIFAVTVELAVTLDAGVWDEPTPGIARWRTRVFSAEAQALLMVFNRFTVPAAAQLWIYDTAGVALQGPYTAANHTETGELWTAMVPGETAVIELQVPTEQKDQVTLSLGRLGHAFKNERDLGRSGSCNIDTACALGNGWRNEIRSVVKLQIPSGLFSVGLCTGTLVNTLAEDGTPYVLTADHCGITSRSAANVVAYWNFQNSGCGGAANAVSTQSQPGATLRADDRGTDMTLIELNQRPQASFKVYYAGWDASGAGGNSGVGIHHPAGDAKKISEFTSALAAADVSISVGGPSIPAWRVERWSQGTTEQGSSGSGLWNQNRQIVGTLSGGSAACSGSVNNGLADFYARLDRQWQANSARSGQLKAWLDPANTGRTQVGGRNASGGGVTPTPTPAPTASPSPTAPGSSDGGGGTTGGALLALLTLAGVLRRKHADNTRPNAQSRVPAAQ